MLHLMRVVTCVVILIFVSKEANCQWALDRPFETTSKEHFLFAGESVLSKPDTLKTLAIEHGKARAEEVSTWSWFRRGVVAGLLGGPIGTIIIYRVADHSTIEVIDTSPNSYTDNPAYRLNFLMSYKEQVIANRKKHAIIGGAVGTGVLIYVLIRAVNLNPRENRGAVAVPTDPPPSI